MLSRERLFKRAIPSLPTRREFLRDCSLVATAAALSPTAVLAQNRRGRTRSAEPLTFELFAALLNTSFSVRAGLRTSRLALVEANRLPPAPPEAEDARNERFSLLFRGPVLEPLGQDTYLFEHPRVGQSAIFIVPMHCTKDTAHCYYEAVFNYPVHPADVVAQLAQAPQPVRRN